MLPFLACALASTPFTLGGGAPLNASLNAGFGAELNRVSVPGATVRRTTHQTLQARLDAVVVPALALTVEANGTNSNTDLGWLITDRVRSAGGGDVDPIAFTARSITGDLFVGLGSQVGNDELEFQLGIGPTVGTNGFTRNTYRRLVDDYGLQPDPTPITVGGRTQLRARGLAAERFALEGRGGAQIFRTLLPKQHLAPARRQDDEPEQRPGSTSVRFSSTVEGQVLVVSDLWITVGVTLENDRMTRKVDGAGTVVSWAHQAVGQLGVRWR